MSPHQREKNETDSKELLKTKVRFTCNRWIRSFCGTVGAWLRGQSSSAAFTGRENICRLVMFFGGHGDPPGKKKERKRDKSQKVPGARKKQRAAVTSAGERGRSGGGGGKASARKRLYLAP
jgi:hypothetical protein